MSTPQASNENESIGAVYGSEEQHVDSSHYKDPQQFENPKQINESFEVPSECVGEACVRATGHEPPAPTHLAESTAVVHDTVAGKPVPVPVVVVKPTIVNHKYVRLALWTVLFILILLVLFASFRKFRN